MQLWQRQASPEDKHRIILGGGLYRLAPIYIPGSKRQEQTYHGVKLFAHSIRIPIMAIIAIAPQADIRKRVPIL